MTTVAMVPALVLAVPFVQQLSRMATENAQRELTLVAERAGDRMLAALQLLLQQTETTVSDSDLYRGVQSLLFMERADLILADLVEEHELLTGAVLLDGQGREVTAYPVVLMEQGLPPTVANLPGQLLAAIRPRAPKPPDYAVEIVRDESFIAEHRRRLDLVLRSATNSFMVVVLPVRGLMRRVVGSLVLYLPGENFAQIGQRHLPPAMGVTVVAQQQPFAKVMPLDADSGEARITASAPITLANPYRSQQIVLEVEVSEPHSRRFAAVEAAIRQTSWLVIIIIIALGLLSLAVATWLVRPMRRLQAIVRRYGEGDYDQPPLQVPFRELQTVADTMGDMGQSIMAHIAELTKQERFKGELARAQLQSELTTLRNQMSPHFLFNAFNSIATMIAIDATDARAMLQKLAELYRAILDGTKKTTIPLQQELAILRNYLDLEKMRFGERLVYAIAWNEQLEPVWVPPLILQTLVENAVKHGIGKARKGGAITIALQRDEEGWCLARVANTGAPWAEPQADQQSTGLANTKQRLDLLYGENHQFSLRTEAGETVVSFRFSGANL